MPSTSHDDGTAGIPRTGGRDSRVKDYDAILTRLCPSVASYRRTLTCLCGWICTGQHRHHLTTQRVDPITQPSALSGRTPAERPDRHMRPEDPRPETTGRLSAVSDSETEEASV